MARREMFARGRDGSLVVALYPQEAELLAMTARDMTSIVEEPPSGDVRDRLYPRAYLDPTEEAAQGEYDALVHDDLVRARRAALQVIIDGIDAGVENRRGVIEIALTADHLIIIGRGRLLADTPTDRFVSGTRQDVLVRSPRADELAGLLIARGAAVRPEGDGGLAVTGLDAPAIGDLAAGHGIAVHELVPRHASLEQAYLDLTGGSTDYRGETSAPEGMAAS